MDHGDRALGARLHLGRLVVPGVIAVLSLGACSASPPPNPAGGSPARTLEHGAPTGSNSATSSNSTTSSSSSTSPPTASPASSPADSPTSTPIASPSSAKPTGPVPSDGRPVEALLSIPTMGLTRLAVQPYEGWTDDLPGTAIQNRGRAASPTGPQGGTGAGGVGNYQVTAHRNSSTAAFFRLPALAQGDVVHLDAGRVRYTYRVTATRETSFRSAASLAEQRAAVPGRPGVAATEAMVTLSTCATQEDHAAGNYWAEEKDNPEHRIDKIGVLVETGPVP